ncbi:MAG: DUF3833 family protein [Pseudomonadota bacterium]
MDGILFAIFGAIIAFCLVWARSRYADFLAQDPEDYTGEAFDLRTQLNGPILCEGVIYGPTGRVSSRFVADFDVTWEGNTGVMREHFKYDDGSTQDRAWNLTLGNDGQVKATAEDVVGTGEGRQAGGSLQLKYRIKLPESSGGHVLDTVDWMYLAPNGTIINRSQFRKYGLKVAELVATMRRVEEPELKEAA